MTVFLRQFVFVNFLLCGIVGFSPARATEIPASSGPPFLIRTWQVEQGLPNDTVNAITQTREGYLWLGTDGGLARFDGVHCRVYGLKDGLGVLQISALLADRTGALWIGTYGGGLSRLDNGKVKTFTTRDGLAGNSIAALLEDANGNVWIGTPTGMNIWHDGKLQTVATNLGPIFVYDFAQDLKTNVWVATLHNGLLSFHDGKLSGVDTSLGTNLNPRCVFVDNQNRIWVSSRDKYILCRDSGGWKRYGTNESLPEITIDCFTQTANGTIWAGSLNGGLYYFQDGQFKVLRQRDGLSDNVILSLFSSEQFLWAGTESGGLYRIGAKKLSVFNVTEDSTDCQLRTMTQTTNGEIYFGTYGQGLFHWDKDKFTQILTNLPASGHLFVEALLAGRDGSLWWGAGPALFQLKDGKLISDYNDTKWLAGDRVWSLCENRDGGIWVGTFNGKLGLVRQNRFKPIWNFSNQPVTALAQEADGTLWIGSLGGGLARLQNSKLTVFTLKDGLPSNSIRTLFLDTDGTLWIGTDDGGLVRHSGDQFINFTPEQGLIDSTILQILEDDDGSLWLGSNRGICRISRRALDDIVQDRISSVHPTVFDRLDGMPSQACVGNFQAAIRTLSGELLFLTSKGCVVIDPKKQITQSAPPKVLFEDMLVDRKALESPPSQVAGVSDISDAEDSDAIIQIPPGRHSFEFHYTAFNFDAPETIQFRYQLKGLDSGWTDAGNSRIAHYSYIPPGRYVFRVAAHNENQLWNPDAAELNFTVLPYFEQTIWFKTALVLCVLGFSGMGIRYFERRRYKTRLKRLEQERAMDRERQRIAQDLHDELGSSLMYISLSISDLGQLQMDDSEKLKAGISKISNFAVRTIRSLDEIVWAVNPRNDSLPSLIEYLIQLTRELLENAGIRCRFQIPQSLPPLLLPPEMRHHVFLIVKEALNNVLKHAHAHEILLTVKTAGRQFELLVQDDGVGFDPALIQTGMEHDGLDNMRRRTDAIGGHLIIERGSDKGTTVRLTVNCPGKPSSKT